MNLVRGTIQSTEITKFPVSMEMLTNPMLAVIFKPVLTFLLGFPAGSDGKESACNVRDLDSIPGLGRFPGEGNGNPLQYSCLEYPMDRGAWCRLLSMQLQRVRND